MWSQESGKRRRYLPVLLSRQYLHQYVNHAGDLSTNSGGLISRQQREQVALSGSMLVEVFRLMPQSPLSWVRRERAGMMKGVVVALDLSTGWVLTAGTARPHRAADWCSAPPA
jgi:hypothetical protein